MSVVTLDQYIGGTKQRINWAKIISRATAVNGTFSVFDVAGQTGAGVLAGTSVAAGVVPVDTDAGYPAINNFAGGAKGYIGVTETGSTVACCVSWYDRLWLGGPYPFNANQALAAQPSFAARLPGGDYSHLEIWVEQVTVGTGVPTVNVTYTDQSGNAGAVTGAQGPGVAAALGRCFQLLLAAGDFGVQKIENVVGAGASAGTFNVMILRPVCEDRVILANELSVRSAIDNGFPEIFDTSALYPLVTTDAAATGIPECSIQIVSG